MSNVKDAVVKRIRALCEEKNIKPNELANRAGLTPSTVYSIFNENRHDVNISTIKILCDGFIITEADFRQLANTISVIQKAIDDVNELLIGGENAEEFVFQSECFLI